MNYMKKYALENSTEFERLEKQSKVDSYNYETELAGFHPKENGTLLDAGCGSGIVSRYLATLYPSAQVIGCDFSAERVKQASEAASSFTNLKFQAEDLTRLSIPNATLDAVVCRYVLEHIADETACVTALKQLHRAMKPGGKLCVVDLDGFMHNLYPQTPLVESFYKRLASERPLDLFIGRKLPEYIKKAGFTDISWDIQTLTFQHGEKLDIELDLLSEKYAQAMPFITSFFGGDSEKARQMVVEYFECARKEGSVLFYNKFIIHAKKTGLSRIE